MFLDKLWSPTVPHPQLTLNFQDNTTNNILTFCFVASTRPARDTTRSPMSPSRMRHIVSGCCRFASSPAPPCQPNVCSKGGDDMRAIFALATQRKPVSTTALGLKSIKCACWIAISLGNRKSEFICISRSLWVACELCPPIVSLVMFLGWVGSCRQDNAIYRRLWRRTRFMAGTWL